MYNLSSSIRNCTLCPLHEKMPCGCKPVHGFGCQPAKIMFIGEALGEQESILEEPFVGQCGQLLDKILNQVGIKRIDCFITNLVKCRPYEQNGKRQKNRPPKQEEIEKCSNWLIEELKLVRPSIIFTLGMLSTKFMLSIKKTIKLGDYVGHTYKTIYSDGIVVPLYHPSFLMQHGKKEIVATVDAIRRFI